MDTIDVTVERSVFPLTRFFLTIGKSNFSLRPGELKKIELRNADEYEVIASSYWLKKKVRLPLYDNAVITIKHGIPDLFYLIGIPVIIILSVLTFFSFINMYYLLGALLIYFLPLCYITFINRKNYFKIIVQPISNEWGSSEGKD